MKSVVELDLESRLVLMVLGTAHLTVEPMMADLCLPHLLGVLLERLSAHLSRPQQRDVQLEQRLVHLSVL